MRDKEKEHTPTRLCVCARVRESTTNEMSGPVLFVATKSPGIRLWGHAIMMKTSWSNYNKQIMVQYLQDLISMT